MNIYDQIEEYLDRKLGREATQQELDEFLKQISGD